MTETFKKQLEEIIAEYESALSQSTIKKEFMETPYSPEPQSQILKRAVLRQL